MYACTCTYYLMQLGSYLDKMFLLLHKLYKIRLRYLSCEVNGRNKHPSFNGRTDVICFLLQYGTLSLIDVFTSFVGQLLLKLFVCITIELCKVTHTTVDSLHCQHSNVDSFSIVTLLSW